jgi:hypothetical protein
MRTASARWSFVLICLTAGFAGVPSPAAADVILTAEGLNATLKKLEKLQQQLSTLPVPPPDETLFQLASEADGLAVLMNQEIEAHGMQEQKLLDLAVSRTKTLGVVIVFNEHKRRYFYDGSGFARYLTRAPNGPHAADSSFFLLQYQFFKSTGTDAAALTSAADATRRFLVRYPAFRGNPEVKLFLAIDYRDLFRHARDAHDKPTAEKYRRLARAQYQRVMREHPGTERSEAARQLLRRLDEETGRTAGAGAER